MFIYDIIKVKISILNCYWKNKLIKSKITIILNRKKKEKIGTFNKNSLD